MDITEKIINFNEYCKTCKHCDVVEFEDPCNDCLDNPVNTNSKKPIHYEMDKEKVKKEEKKNEKN